MAVVLPIHSHLDFSNPTENDYESRCQKEEAAREERLEENENSSLFTNRHLQSEITNNNTNNTNTDNKNDNDNRDYPRPRCLPLLEKEEKQVQVDRNDRGNESDDNTSMDIGDSADNYNINVNVNGCSEPNTTNATAVPLNALGQDDVNADDEDADSDAMDSDINNDNDNDNEGESDHAVDENSAFISSLMAVDLASTTNDESEDPIESKSSNGSGSGSESESTTASHIVNFIRMDDERNENDPNEEEEADDSDDDDNNMTVVEMDEIPDIIDDTTLALTTPTTANIDIDIDILAEVEAEAILLETEDMPEASSIFYGGLKNLGNTCYMASAIQLLCGLDSFPAELKSTVPPESNINTNDENTDGIMEDAKSESKSESLRDAFLDVMDRLGNGETVRPDDLKRCIDARTSLFLGYHQQDSHEFLTTLLDMIDEDYKIKARPTPKPEETKLKPTTTMITATVVEPDNNSSNGDGIGIMSSDESHETIGNANEHLSSKDGSENENKEHENNNDENDQENNDDGSCDQKSLESALKRQKVVEEQTLVESEKESTVTSSNTSTSSTAIDATESGGEEPTDADAIQRSKSYSDFKFSDIESLLHYKDGSSTTARIAAAAATTATTTIATRQDEPKCKLAGGRMSTSGVELTRFVEDANIDETVRPTGASLDKATPHQQIVEEGHHDDMEEEQEREETSSLSPVSSNFTTKVRVCLTCESCKFRRSHIETYLHISLDISTGSNDDGGIGMGISDDDDNCGVGTLGCPSSSSIEDGLRKFFAPEKRDIKCEKCFHTSALQTSEITQLPRNLLFHLKRFIVDVSPDYSSISYRKDQSPVFFDERMELEATDGGSDSDSDSDADSDCDSDNENNKNNCSNNNNALRNAVHDDEEGGFRDFLALDCSYAKGAAYEIRSVVNHIGSSASCGHYTADAKRRKKRTRSGNPLSGEEQDETEDEMDNNNETSDHTDRTKEEDRSDSDSNSDSDDRQWIRFNDSYVSKISSKEAVEDASQTAYMIMYELV
jgi:ubiquitin C-terminal hydrolase